MRAAPFNSPHVHFNKSIVGVLIVIVMGLTSLWGVYAPTFSEAYVLPVQMTDASGATLGNFQCRPVAAENGKTLLVFRNKDFLRQNTGGMVHSQDHSFLQGSAVF